MRSRLRKLHVDGAAFTWKADILAGPRRIRVRAWGAEAGKNGQALQADLAVRPGADRDAYAFPEADEVRVLIRHALANGWVPATRGGTYLLTSVSQVTLPDFTLVQP
jgi:hypothetical protein